MRMQTSTRELPLLMPTRRAASRRDLALRRLEAPHVVRVAAPVRHALAWEEVGVELVIGLAQVEGEGLRVEHEDRVALLALAALARPEGHAHRVGLDDRRVEGPVEGECMVEELQDLQTRG